MLMDVSLRNPEPGWCYGQLTNQPSCRSSSTGCVCAGVRHITNVCQALHREETLFSLQPLQITSLIALFWRLFDGRASVNEWLLRACQCQFERFQLTFFYSSRRLKMETSGSVAREGDNPETTMQEGAQKRKKSAPPSVTSTWKN